MGKKEFIESLKSLGEKRALSTEAESTLSQFKKEVGMYLRLR